MSTFKSGEYDLMITPRKSTQFKMVLEKIAEVEGETLEAIQKKLWRAIMADVQSGCFPAASQVRTGTGVPDRAFTMSFSGEVFSASIDTELMLVVLHDITGP